jgi:chromosome segregation ATPase
MKRLCSAMTVAALFFTGCAESQPRSDKPVRLKFQQDEAEAASAVQATAVAQVNAHLRDLEDKIARLERQTGSGRGAMRYGSSLRVDGGAQETVLERLRRLEGELLAAKTDVAERSKDIDSLRDSLSSAEQTNQSLNERADVLEHAHDSLETAQQELADRQKRMTTLSDQLAASELARLRIERLYYQIAAGVVKLSPGQTQDLVDMQERVRNQVKELNPQAGTKQ